MSRPGEIETASTTRRNVIWSAVNHFFVEGGMTLSDPSAVLPLMIMDLGGSHVLAGLLPSLRFFGWLLPQFFVAGPLQRMRRFLPTVRMLESVRIVVYIGLAGLLVWLGLSRPGLVLAVFFVLFVLTRFAAGSSAVARAELIARMVPHGDRSTVVSIRSLTGDIGGLLAGFGVAYLLSPATAPFPRNYAWLLGVSGCAFALGAAAISAVYEPPGAPRGNRVELKEQIRRTPDLVTSDRRFSLYVLVRAAAAGSNIADPFYVLYATEILGAAPALAGLYLSARMLTRMCSNLLWAYTCKRKSNLWTLRAARLLGLLPPLAVLVFGLANLLQWQGSPPEYAGVLFAVVFAVQGLGISADGISRVAYLYEIAPDADRPTYFGLSNTLLGPLYFLPTLGGLLVTLVGYAPIFWVAVALAALGYLLSLRISAS